MGLRMHEWIPNSFRQMAAFIVDRMLPSIRTSGLRVTKWSGHADPSADFAKVRSALMLIEKWDNYRFSLVQQHMSRIALIDKGGELYDHRIRTYIMDRGLLAKRSVPHIAMSIVHEMTHARLRVKGIRTNEKNAERIERICVSQEISFARRLPDESELVAFAESKMGRRWWGREEAAKRLSQQVESLDLPRWFIRLKRAFSRD